MAAEFYDDVALPDRFEPDPVTWLEWPVQIKTRFNRVEDRRLRGEQPIPFFELSYDADPDANAITRQLQNLYNAVGGPLAGFRALDPADHQIVFSGAAAQVLGTGDDVEDTFQLIKTYTFGSRTRNRILKKPVDPVAFPGRPEDPTQAIALTIDGTPIVEDTDYTVDYSTGLITLTNPLPMGQILRATGGWFHCPVRFEKILQFRSGTGHTNIPTEPFKLIGLVL